MVRDVHSCGVTVSTLRLTTLLLNHLFCQISVSSQLVANFDVVFTPHSTELFTIMLSTQFVKVASSYHVTTFTVAYSVVSVTLTERVSDVELTLSVTVTVAE